MEFALVVGLLSYGGYLLDAKHGTVPLWTLIGLVLGFSVGFYQLYTAVFGRKKKKG